MGNFYLNKLMFSTDFLWRTCKLAKYNSFDMKHTKENTRMNY